MSSHTGRRLLSDLLHRCVLQALRTLLTAAAVAANQRHEHSGISLTAKYDKYDFLTITRSFQPLFDARLDLLCRWKYLPVLPASRWLALRCMHSSMQKWCCWLYWLQGPFQCSILWTEAACGVVGLECTCITSRSLVTSSVSIIFGVEFGDDWRH